jgi:hypothetical protein
MSLSLTNRILVAAGEVSLLVAALLVAPIVSATPASATAHTPGFISETAAPAGILFDSPWIVDANGTQWTYATTVDKMGTLVSRNPVTGQFTTTPIAAGDEGAVAGVYSRQTNVAVFSVRRTGLQRMISFNLSNRTRLSSRSLADGETNIRALAFNSTSSSFIIGSNHSPPKVSKFDTASGFLDYSKSLGSSVGEVTSFIQNGTNLLATINSSPVTLVPVASSTLTASSPITLPTTVPTIVDPIVVGTTAFVGTSSTPGRVTAIDIPTKAVIGSVSLDSDETGARNLALDSNTGTLYATTETSAGTRLVSFTVNELVRKGHVDLGAGTSATSILLHGQRLSVAFAGSRGFLTLTTAPAPEAPLNLVVGEMDRELAVNWTASSSVEPVIDYTVTVASGGSPATCVTEQTQCNVPGLQNGVDYTVSVVARSIAGESEAVTGVGNPFTTPQPPSDLEVLRGNTELRVNWSAGDSGGRPALYSTATANPSGVSCITTGSTCVLSGIPNGAAQTVTVVTRTIAGESAPSAASDPLAPATVPGAPDSVVAAEMNGGVELTWQPPNNDGGDSVVGYRLDVWAGESLVGTTNTTHLTHTITGLANNVTHRFVLIAVNGVGGGATATIFATPTAPPEPDPPVVDPPVVDPPVVDPPVVDPPVVDPPVVDPPVVDPPVVDPDTPTPPTLSTAPAAPVSLVILRATRKHLTVGWQMTDVGTAPISDFVVQISRFASRGYRTIDDGQTTEAWVKLRKPRNGSLYLRVIAINSVGESPPSAPKRVIRR